jgi:hypothetical protein
MAIPNYIFVPDSVHGPFNERTTRKFGGPAVGSTPATVIKDENGVPIPGSSLTTMTYTIFGEADPQTIINARDHIDCKPNVDANGVFTLVLAPADMAILDDTLVLEFHGLLLEWTYNSGMAGKHYARIIVKNLERVA